MRTPTKTSFKQWQILPPVFNNPARGICRTTLEKDQSEQLLFPLPQGEDQGEGGGRRNPPAKRDFQRP